VSIILSRAQILFDSELKARLSEMVDNSRFSGQNHAELRRYATTETFQNFLKLFCTFGFPECNLRITLTRPEVSQR
jgi:hypothetical protein